MRELTYILGTGNFGRIVLQGVRRLGLRPKGFIDLNQMNIGTKIDGLDVVSFKAVKEGHIIISSNRNNLKFLINLVKKNPILTYEICDFVFEDYVYDGQLDLDWSPSRVDSEIKNFLIRIKEFKNDFLALIKAAPPPGITPPLTAARVACKASSTRSFISSNSASVNAPILIMATPPDNLAKRD
jgi:hypothetical protein